jgi:hypothetical protein
MRKLALLFAVALCFVSMPVLAAEDFSGKWSGTFSGLAPNGQQVTENIYMVLVHKGAELTGTAGPSADRQWKILKGKADEKSVYFEVQAENDSGPGPYIKISLTFADGHLKGDFNGERGTDRLAAKVDVTRVK